MKYSDVTTTGPTKIKDMGKNCKYKDRTWCRRTRLKTTAWSTAFKN